KIKFVNLLIIMLDIHLFVSEKGGNLELIKESQKKRGSSEEIVDKIFILYKSWTAERFVLDSLNREMNVLQKEISAKIKSKEDVLPLLVKKQELQVRRKEAEVSEAEKERVLKQALKTVGNIVHDSVPVSKNENDNEVIRTWAPECVLEKKDCLSYHEVLLRLDGYDPERGVKVVGHRGYFLKGCGVLLSQALINYSLNFLIEKGYIVLQTPHMMNKDMMSKTAELTDFDDQLYKVIDGDDEKYLIATSEQPISAFHAGEWFESPNEQLPIKYAGLSSCYRREAGAHGKDTWGIFRVHQFDKVEQFLITSPESSWTEFEEMINISEEFYKSLSIPYRIVSIVSGALNNAASKKYDLEAWFPYQEEYKELVSCSNCTDYQSRNLEIRCGIKRSGDKEKKYVHCLNATLCAVTRALCCILENYQTPDGINIPEPLQNYIGGKKFLPFTRSLPRNILVTGNTKKAQEINDFFGTMFNITCVALDLPEIQGKPHEIVIDKCMRAADIIKEPVIVEDTSLFFTALNGLPGPYIKWFLSSLGLDGLVRILEPFSDKTAEAFSVFAYSEGPGQDVHVFEGKTYGTIVPARGSTKSEFGWDAIFQPIDSHQTYAEMDYSLKNVLSHRVKALTKFLSFLRHSKQE
ncbi:hypothetical protein PCK1_002564, partial [Pneumocystis canis]